MSPVTGTPPQVPRLCLAGVALVLLLALAGAAADDASPLRGQVLSAEGRPFPGATVTFRATPDDDDDAQDFAARPTVVRTDKDGRFAGGETGVEQFDVRVQAPDHAFQTLQWTVAADPITVTLNRGHALTGRVLAKTTGEGISGARVEIADSEDFELGAGDEVTTDNEGRYRFPHVPAGNVWIRATGSGWARRSVRGEVRATTTEERPTALDDLWLPEGGNIAGRVVDTKGQPVTDAELTTLAVDRRREGRQFLFPHMQTWTDETGRYEFEGVTAGTSYRVRAKHGSYSPAVAGPFAIDSGTSLRDVDLTLQLGAKLRFRLVDEEDRPCTRATIHLDSEEDARADLAISQLKRSTETGGILAGDAGWLSVERLSPGRYTIRIEPQDRVELQEQNVVLIEGETTDLGTIELNPGSTMRGRVIDESRKPVADAEVFVRWQTLTGRYERRTISDTDGRFSLGGLPGHSLKLEVVADEFAVRKLEDVQAGSDEIIATLARRGGIRGTVKLADGNMQSSFSVRIYDNQQFLIRGPKAEIEGGSFEVRDLTPGKYGMEIRASGRAPGRLEKVQVRSGEITDAGMFVLRPGLRLDGRVSVADGGTPVAGATVRIDRGAGPPRWSQETSELVTVSDAMGVFTFDELDSGRFTLTLFHPEFAPAQRSLDLEPEMRKTVIEIGMTSGGEIRGVVIDADGLPVAGADLLVYRGSRAFDLRMTSTGKDGSFRFSRLAAGTYIVMRNGSPAQSFARQIKSVDLREGQVKQVKFADTAD